MDGAELLVKSLEQVGVEYIFGIPGDTKGKNAVSETFFFRELKKSKIKFIRTTHEQNAGYMADLYGRVSGRPGVCYTTLGPGSTNIGTALATANLDRSPVVCISSQLPSKEWHKDTHQYIDMKAEFRHKTKLALSVSDINQIPEVVKKAFDTASSGRPGSVHIEVPVDIFEEYTEESAAIKQEEKIYPKLNPSNIIELLNNSKFPLLVLGRIANEQTLSRKIQEFMEKYNVHALSTFHGKGSIPYDHPLYLGVLSRHLPQTGQILSESDLLLNVGFDYAEGIKPRIWETGANKKIVDIDYDEKTGGSFYNPDYHYACDVKELFENLSKSNGIKTFEKKSFQKFGLKNFDFKQTGFPINPLRFVQKLRDNTNDNDIVVVDVGEHKQVMGLFFDVKNPKSIFFSNGHSTLGYASPGALGAKVAEPNRRVIAVVGDGGFQLTCQEVITSVNSNLPIKVIILNDGAYGIIKHEQEKAFGDHYGVEFKSPDFVKWAKSMGAEGYRVKSSESLGTTLKKALSSNKTAVIEVPITYRNKLW